jgi:DNA-binding CsgD family transcriptional regulator
VVARGGRFVPPELRAELNQPAAARRMPRAGAVEPREREVLGLVLKGSAPAKWPCDRAFGQHDQHAEASAYRKLGIRGDGDLFRFRHLLECG